MLTNAASTSRSSRTSKRTANAKLEVRATNRADVELRAELSTGGLRRAVVVRNVSAGGACVVGLELVAGARVGLRIDLGYSVVDVRGVVIAARVLADGTRGFGVRFDATSQEAESELSAFVDSREPMAWAAGSEPGVMPQTVALHFVPILRRMAAGLARRVPSSVNVDDLVGAGFVGLIEAYNRWSQTSREDFERLAVARMRGAMLDELRSVDPLSRRRRSLSKKIDRATSKLWVELGRRPSEVEVAKAVGMSVAMLRTAARDIAVGAPTSLDSEDAPVVCDLTTRSAEEQLGRADAARRLEMARAALPDRLRKVLELYYGDELTLAEIGNMLGVTESRICQVLSQAVRTLRTQMAEAA